MDSNDVKALLELQGKKLDDHATKFDEFHGDWKAHRKEARDTMQKVDSIHSSIQAMAPHLVHLSQLPLIASSTASLEKGLITQNSELISQLGVGSREKSRAFDRLLQLVMIVALIGGAYSIISAMKESVKDLTISPTSFSLTSPTSRTIKKSE